MDIFTKKWSEPCLKATAPELGEKLGNPTPPTAILVLYFLSLCRHAETRTVSSDSSSSVCSFYCIYLYNSTCYSIYTILLFIFIYYSPRALFLPILSNALGCRKTAKWWLSLETILVWLNKLLLLQSKLCF